MGNVNKNLTGRDEMKRSAYEGKFKSHDTSNSNARRFTMSFNQILKLWEVVSWNRSQRHGMEVVMFRSFFEEEAEKYIISKTL